jgi:hypothetical protein
MASQDQDKPSGGIASFSVGFGDPPAQPGVSDAPPLRVALVSELLPRLDHATTTLPRAAVLLTNRDLDAVMADRCPGVRLQVRDPSQPGRLCDVEVPLGSLGAFRPRRIQQSVPSLQGISDPTAPPRGEAAGDPLGSLLDQVGFAGETAQSEPGSLLAAVVAHPELRRLERAWRGAHLLASHLGRGGEILLLPVSAAETAEALAALAASDEGQTVDLVIVDHAVTAVPADLARLVSWAEAAEQLCAPLVAIGDPSLLGAPSLESVARATRDLTDSTDPRAVAFRAVQTRDACRWVTLVANAVLAREPHAPGLAEPEPLRIGPSIVVGALAAQSHARTGWACQLTGPAHGRLDGLPVQVQDGVASPLEVVPNLDAVHNAGQAGLAMLTGVANRDAVVLVDAPSVWGSPRGRASLGMQLFVSRLSRAVVQLASAIPAATEPRAAEEVVRVMLAELFSGAGGAGPEFAVRVDATQGMLHLAVGPRGFLNLGRDEFELTARLG